MLRHTCLIYVAAVFAVCNLAGCKTTKQTSTMQVERSQIVDSSFLINTEEVLTIDYFDDELTGLVPFDIEQLQTRDSLVIPVKSKGIDLEMVVKKTGISYNTKVKPVARSKLQKQENSQIEYENKMKERRKEEEKVIEKPSGFRFPWWMWILLIIAAIITVLRLLKVIQNPLKLF